MIDYGFRVTETTVRGEYVAAVISFRLIKRSMWFVVTPLPCDDWMFTVKSEEATELDRIVTASTLGADSRRPRRA